MADLHDPVYSSRQATYDLCRLRLKGFIEWSPADRATGSPPAAGPSPPSSRASRHASSPPCPPSSLTPPARPAAHPAPLVTAWRAYDRELLKFLKDFAAAAQARAFGAAHRTHHPPPTNLASRRQCQRVTARPRAHDGRPATPLVAPDSPHAAHVLLQACLMRAAGWSSSLGLVPQTGTSTHVLASRQLHLRARYGRALY